MNIKENNNYINTYQSQIKNNFNSPRNFESLNLLRDSGELEINE